MDYFYQQKKTPLYPDIVWSKPENKKGAGKLLIIGGQAQEFAGVATAYMAAEAAGAGTIRVIMPDSTQKFTKMLPNIEYAPSNPSGSFSKHALASFLDASSWADHVLLPGDLGKNSETTTILDGYLLKCPTQATISQDALQTVTIPGAQLLRRPLSLVLDLKSMQKLATELGSLTAITSNTGQAQIAEVLHEITMDKKGPVLYVHEQSVWVAYNGNVCVAEKNDQNINTISAKAAIWAMQQPTKLFEALVSSIL